MRRFGLRVFIAVVAILLLACPQGSFSRSKKRVQTKKQIMVFAQRIDGTVHYKIQGEAYKSGELDYLLGEMHVDAAPDSEVVVILEDSMALSDIKAVPAMAMKAGFTDVRAFVYWKGTGNMAEVWFGPVTKVKKQGYVE